MKNTLTSVLNIGFIFALVFDLISMNIFPILFVFIFMYLKKVNYPLITFKLACNIILLCICILTTIVFANQIQNFIQIGTIDSNHLDNLSFLLEFVNNFSTNRLLELISLFFGFYNFKILFELKPIQMFGAFISTIEKILKKVVTFFILFILILIAFAAIGSVSFSTLGFSSEFESFDRALVTLISYTFGAFSLNVYYENLYFYNRFTYYEVVIFCFVFLFIFNIFLINLLIGLISAIYSSNEDNEKELFLFEIYKESKLLSDCSRFSSLTSSYPLIILFTIPLYLGYFIFKPQSVNQIILCVQYLLILLFNFIVLFIFNLILVPLAYFIGIFKLLRTMRILGKIKLENFIGFVCYISFGIIFLLMSVIINAFQLICMQIKSEIPCKEIDHISFIPSILSFKDIFKELKALRPKQQINDESIFPNIGIEIYNPLISKFYTRIRNNSQYSKIDLIFFSTIFEICSTDNCDLHSKNLSCILKSQKWYYKLFFKQILIKPQSPKEKWSSFLEFARPKISFKNIQESL